MSIAPCKNCKPENRPRACHDTCSRYIAWRNELEETKRRKEQDNIYLGYIATTVVNLKVNNYKHKHFNALHGGY